MLGRSYSARLWRSSATALRSNPLTANIRHNSAGKVVNRRQLQECTQVKRSQHCSSTASWSRPATQLCSAKRSTPGCTASAAFNRRNIVSVGGYRLITRSAHSLQHSTMAPLEAASFAEPETYAEQLRVKVMPGAHLNSQECNGQPKPVGICQGCALADILVVWRRP